MYTSNMASAFLEQASCFFRRTPGSLYHQLRNLMGIFDHESLTPSHRSGCVCVCVYVCVCVCVCVCVVY